MHVAVEEWKEVSTITKGAFDSFSPQTMPTSDKASIMKAQDFETPTKTYTGCGRCGHYGHRSKQCPFKERPCDHCGTMGHASEMCRKGQLSSVNARKDTTESNSGAHELRDECTREDIELILTPFCKPDQYRISKNPMMPPPGRPQVLQVVDVWQHGRYSLSGKDQRSITLKLEHLGFIPEHGDDARKGLVHTRLGLTALMFMGKWLRGRGMLRPVLPSMAVF